MYFVFNEIQKSFEGKFVKFVLREAQRKSRMASNNGLVCKGSAKDLCINYGIQNCESGQIIISVFLGGGTKE